MATYTANDLQNRVAIYKYDRSENLGGTPIEEWKLYKYTYASIKVSSGALQMSEGPGLVAVNQIEIVLRYDPLIDYDCQIVFEQNTYTINHIEQVNHRGFLRLRCDLYNEAQPYGNRI